MRRAPLSLGAAVGAVQDVLGVVLAGGQNRRYGEHKALAMLGGKRIIDRAIGALSGAVCESVIVANDLGLYGSLGLDVRPDIVPDSGVLGGILTAVGWADEKGCRAALVVACDMPFLSPSLLALLAERAESDAVWTPESRGPRGIEPLCAAYGVKCREAIERTLAAGERAVISALARLPTRRLPRSTIERYGDPDVLFLNVNRPADRDRAEALLDTEAERDMPGIRR